MKELTYEDWKKNPVPREMWVWDDNAKVKRKVVYFIENEDVSHPVIALSSDGITTANYKHCAEIEEPRRMTYRELSWWLSDKPHREYRYKDNDFVFRTLDYKESKQKEEVTDMFLIRENGGEWKEPLIKEFE